MHYIRPLFACDEIAFPVFGQAVLHLGPDLGVLVVGVEPLQLRPLTGTGVAESTIIEEFKGFFALNRQVLNIKVTRI